MMGGELAQNCGYKFTPIETFDEVFGRLNKKNRQI